MTIDLPNTPVFRGSACTALVRCPRERKMAYRRMSDIEHLAFASAREAMIQYLRQACRLHKITRADLLAMLWSDA